MKLLLTGGNGQVAWDIKQLASENNYLIWAPAKEELDISDAQSVLKAIMSFSPDVVINAAAYTAVDQAEKEKEQALNINAVGPKWIAEACQKIKCLLVHLSTDYIFSGENKLPYSEADKADPINYYGMSKWQGEQAINATYDRAMILRVSGVFGFHGNNFVKTILRLAREKEQLRIVSDQVTCPTPSRDIAKTVFKMIETPHFGTYHYCSEKAVSWYDFACRIISIAEREETFAVKTLEAIPSAAYPTLARRPAYSVLNCTHIKKTFGLHQPNWEQGLRDVIKQLSTH